jgi:hypothetical protein
MPFHGDNVRAWESYQSLAFEFACLRERVVDRQKEQTVTCLGGVCPTPRILTSRSAEIRIEPFPGTLLMFFSACLWVFTSPQNLRGRSAGCCVAIVELVMDVCGLLWRFTHS